MRNKTAYAVPAPSRVGAQLLQRLVCANDVNMSHAARIAQKALRKFGTDEVLRADLLHATTLDQVSDALSGAYTRYVSCPSKKHQGMAMRIKTFMYNKKLS